MCGSEERPNPLPVNASARCSQGIADPGPVLLGARKLLGTTSKALAEVSE